MNAKCSITLKCIDLSYTLNGFFTHERFCNIIHWSFEKQFFSELCGSPQKLTDFLKQCQKITLVITTTELIRNFFKHWDIVLLTSHGS